MTTLTLSVKELNKALAIFAPLTRKSALPVLTTMLVKVNNDRVTLAATSLTTYASYEIDNLNPNIEAMSNFTVFVSDLAKIVKSTKAATIELTWIDNGKTVQVTAGNLTTTLYSIDAQEFPFAPDKLESLAICEIDAKSLRHALTLTDLAAEHDGIRDILNAIYTSINDKGVTFVGCDSRQLSEVVIDGLSHGTANALIQVKAVKPILSAIDKKSTTPVRVEILQSASVAGNALPYIQFNIGPATIITRSLDGKYPDYKVIIPRDMAQTYRVLPGELSDATAPMKDAYCFIAEFGSNGHVDLIQHDKTLPALTTSVPVYAMPPLRASCERIALDPGFVHLFAKSAQAAGVISMGWGVNDKNMAVTFTGLLDTGAEYEYVLMPMYLTDEH